jgi:hypothetical protein
MLKGGTEHTISLIIRATGMISRVVQVSFVLHNGREIGFRGLSWVREMLVSRTVVQNKL